MVILLNMCSAGQGSRRKAFTRIDRNFRSNPGMIRGEPHYNAWGIKIKRFEMGLLNAALEMGVIRGSGDGKLLIGQRTRSGQVPDLLDRGA